VPSVNSGPYGLARWCQLATGTAGRPARARAGRGTG
jgi:hypothetical protein